jgi:hypothetical protein
VSAVSFTVVETVPWADGRRPLLTKIHGPSAGQIQQYDKAEYFMFCLVAVRDDEMFEFLTMHGPHPHHALLRGALASGVDFSRPQRRLLNKQPDGATPTVERGASVGWAAFDLDRSLPAPGIDWRTHPREAAQAIAQRDLPPWATGADYVAYYSGSQGFADAMKLRVFVILERPITSADLKRLMKAGPCPVDLALYSDAQLHYTATPLFTGNVVDPLPNGRHYFFKRERRRAVVPPLPANARVTLPSSREPGGLSLPPSAGRAGRIFVSRNPGSAAVAIEREFASMGEQANGKEGFHQPAIRALSILFSACGPDSDPTPIIGRWRHAVETRGQRDAAYIERETCGLFHFAESLSLRERHNAPSRRWHSAP